MNRVYIEFPATGDAAVDRAEGIVRYLVDKGYSVVWKAGAARGSASGVHAITAIGHGDPGTAIDDELDGLDIPAFLRREPAVKLPE